jgi:hypothetical protein
MARASAGIKRDFKINEIALSGLFFIYDKYASRFFHLVLARLDIPFAPKRIFLPPHSMLMVFAMR